MPQLDEVLSVTKTVEEKLMAKMEEVQAQIQCASTAKDTVAKIAEEFRTFRQLVYQMLGLLRNQIHECSKQVDAVETRHRRKALVINGIVEAEGEDCGKLILDLLNHKLSLGLEQSSIKSCHRLGGINKDHCRPILVHFNNIQTKASVWRLKTKLKGSPVSMKEFLTRCRQAVFGRARQHFGMRSCWTQDCIITIKTADGKRHKVTSMDDLNALITRFPRNTRASPVELSTGSSEVEAGGSLKNTK
ncbi:hypothetical protein HW555_009318 [Spodoptera exigua]|uniref:Uncharacterized protein n=1 Tax=Spodoptera exigua TaxID=7107 RepID=A0A835L1Y2_SPOEX|nr:hypothetical protein HW555_009318 [Spodoptera exigua]